MAKRSVGKPRFYAPLDQYLKAKGYYRGARTGNMTEFVQGEEVWNMNPTQPFQYTLTTFFLFLPYPPNYYNLVSQYFLKN